MKLNKIINVQQLAQCLPYGKCSANSGYCFADDNDDDSESTQEAQGWDK